MRILLTSHRMWPHVGGTEVAVDRLATQYAARGHEVIVATSAEEGSPAKETRNGYEIRRYEMRRVGKFRFPPREYRTILLRERFDVVHMHGQRVWSSDHLYRTFRRSLSPIVFTAHGFFQWHRERVPVVDSTYYKLVLPRVLRHVARIGADTEGERQDLLAWGVPDAHIVVLPMGYDPAEFVSLPEGFRARYGFSPDETLLLYAGGFYPNKRVDRLVEAAAGQDATLVVLGVDADGSQARMEALAKDVGTRFRALGRIPRSDVLSAYRECDMFLLGSDFEGYGLVLLEAMAAGLPFLSTPSGAAPDLASAGGGIIAAPEGFRDALAALLADPARRETLSQQGREAAKRYTWERVATRYLELFEEIRRR